MLVNILFRRRGRRAVAFSFAQESLSLIPAQKFNKYYLPRLQEVDPLAKSILQTMASPKCSITVLKNMLQNYRELEYKRNPCGLVTLIAALHESREAELHAFCRHLVEFIIRSSSVGEFTCDQHQLAALLPQFAIKRTQSFEKIKETSVKYKLAELLLANHTAIAPAHFHHIITLLTNNDRLTVTAGNRFITLADLFTQKVLAFIREYLNNPAERRAYEKVLTPQLINSFFFYFKEYPTRTDADAKTLFDLAERAIFSERAAQERAAQERVGQKRVAIVSVHRNFPYSSRDEKGEYFKDLILRKIMKRAHWLEEGDEWSKSLLCYSILSFEFYKTMDSLQFRYEQDLNYLTQQDLRVPQLPDYYWETYRQSPTLINRDHISRKIIKQVYPQRYISTPLLDSSTIVPPKLTENEIKIRTMAALEALGVEWKREVEVSGRYVDFLVGDVIIECDGDYHFDLYRMDYNESTHFRNLHLLLSGYKLLIFNIFEYNRHRTTDALAELLKKKLHYLKINDAVMIL